LFDFGHLKKGDTQFDYQLKQGDTLFDLHLKQGNRLFDFHLELGDTLFMTLTLKFGIFLLAKQL
jgi:hypothetical protein